MQIIIIIAALALLFCNVWYVAVPLFVIGLILDWFTDREEKPKKKSKWAEYGERMKKIDEFIKTPEGQEKKRIYDEVCNTTVMRSEEELKAREEWEKAIDEYVKNQSTESES